MPNLAEGVEMNTITITRPEDRFGKLNELAKHFGMTPKDLAHTGVEDLLTRPDETFRQILDSLLKKVSENLTLC